MTKAFPTPSQILVQLCISILLYFAVSHHCLSLFKDGIDWLGKNEQASSPSHPLEMDMETNDSNEIKIDVDKLVVGAVLRKKRKYCRKMTVEKYLVDKKKKCRSLQKIPITTCQGFCQNSWIFKNNSYIQKNYNNIDMGNGGGSSESDHGKNNEQQQYQCVPSRIIKKHVEIFCDGDSEVDITSSEQNTKHYYIQVARSCQCKKVVKEHDKDIHY